MTRSRVGVVGCVQPQVGDLYCDLLDASQSSMCAAVSACPHRKLVSKVSVRHFCRLSPQALSFLNETISECPTHNDCI
jgi:hypothetical protein